MYRINSFKEYLMISIATRKGPLIITRNSFVFLWAIMIFSRLLYRALSRCSSVFSRRNLFTSFSSWVSLKDFLVTKKLMTWYNYTFELWVICARRYLQLTQIPEYIVVQVVHQVPLKLQCVVLFICDHKKYSSYKLNLAAHRAHPFSRFLAVSELHTLFKGLNFFQNRSVYLREPVELLVDHDVCVLIVYQF